jgi:predicted outer membrane protein
MLRILATAYGKAGRYPEAIEAAKMALQRAESQSNTPLAAAISKELAGYEAGAKSPK